MTTQDPDPDRSTGLYSKYRVEKCNGKPTGPVFVLAYAHDKHAQIALKAYADSCEAEFPALADDLRYELRRHGVSC